MHINTPRKELMDGDVIVTGPGVWVVCTLRCRRGKKMERSALHLSISFDAVIYRCTSSTTGSEYCGLHMGSLSHTCIHAASSLSSLEVSLFLFLSLSLSLSRCLSLKPLNRGKPLHSCHPPLHPHFFWCRVPLMHSTLEGTSIRPPFWG